MKKILLIIFSILIPLKAFPIPFLNFYAEGFGGLNCVNDKKKNLPHLETDTGYIAGGKLGYALTCFLRAEIECAYRVNSYSQFASAGHLSDKMRTISVMGNGVLDFSLPLVNKFVIPFFGVGVGNVWDEPSVFFKSLDWAHLKKVRINRKTCVYQIIAGGAIRLSRSGYLTFNYHYLPIELTNQSFDVGLRISF